MRKRLLLGGGLTVCLGILVPLLLPLLHRPGPGVTRENFLRIRKGMTEKEVGAILGGPGMVGSVTLGGYKKDWAREDGQAHVRIGFFDGGINGGTVRSGSFSSSGEVLYLPDVDEESLVTKLRRWLGF
jgi:hypothetical protein